MIQFCGIEALIARAARSAAADYSAVTAFEFTLGTEVPEAVHRIAHGWGGGECKAVLYNCLAIPYNVRL